MPGRLAIILTVGGLANLGCLAYLLLGVTEQGDLRSQIHSHSSKLATLRNSLPESSRQSDLTNQIEIMSRRMDDHKRRMAYDFGDLVPEKFEESPQVVVSDRLSQATETIQSKFQSANKSAPSERPGLPGKPTSDADQKQYLKQLRQIHLAEHIVDVLLKNNVTEVVNLSSAEVSSDHPVASRLQELNDMSILTGPLHIKFRAPLEQATSVLTQFQSAPSYLQVFDLEFSSESNFDGNKINGDEPVLNVALTVAPVYEAKPKPDGAKESEESGTSQTDEQEETDDAGETDNLFD